MSGPMEPGLEERLRGLQRQINDLKSALANNIDETQTIIAKQCRQADAIRTLELGMPKNGFAGSERNYYDHSEIAARARKAFFARSPVMDYIEAKCYWRRSNDVPMFQHHANFERPCTPVRYSIPDGGVLPDECNACGKPVARDRRRA